MPSCPRKEVGARTQLYGALKSKGSKAREAGADGSDTIRLKVCTVVVETFPAIFDQ
jgi:hypothetical protein